MPTGNKEESKYYILEGPEFHIALIVLEPNISCFEHGRGSRGAMRHDGSWPM